MISINELLYLYLTSFLLGIFLMSIDIQNGDINNSIDKIFNNNKCLYSAITKQKFFYIYIFITVFLYLIPVLNTVILVLHGIFSYFERNK